MENERVNSELSRVNNSLIAQLQVLQEKDRVWREKSFSVDSRHEALKEEIELLTIRLSSAEDKNEELTAGLSHEASYKRRVRAWVRPLVDALKSKLIAARIRVQELDREVASRDATISDLRERVAEAVHQMQSQERTHSRDQTRLIEQYEQKVTDLESELSKLKNESRLLKDKALRLDEAVGQRTELENRIVYLERKNQDTEDAFTSELRQTQEQVAKYRQEAKVLAVETLEYDRKLQTASTELTAMRDENSRLQDQFESLQTLWSEAQKKLEASKLQQESLNRLNQELSRQLKEQRKAMESATIAKAVAAHATAAAPAPSSPAPEARETAGEPLSEVASAPAPSSSSPTQGTTGERRMERINSLLAQLESGFTRTRAAEAAPIKDLEIEEKPTETSEDQKSEPPTA